MIRVVALVILLVLPHTFSIAEQPDDMNTEIDQRAFALGSLSAFAEMVRVGVKTLALSAALTPEEMDSLVADAERIAREEGVLLYREPDLIVTDLFPAGVAAGKHVLLIYKGETLQAYQALKKRKSELVASGSYAGDARRDIARQFGKLLSYPDANIEELINNNRGP